MKWNLRHLRIFAATVRIGSVRRAAEACHVTQPAVSLANAKVARLAGDVLFERTPRGHLVTPAGEVLASRAERAFDFLDPALKGFSPRLLVTATTSQLQTLIAVAESQNFTLAARRLGIAQPTVHRSVSQLERDSGRALFQRTSFGVVPTIQTRGLVQAVRLAFAELDQAGDEISERAGRQASQIVVGASRSSTAYVLPQAILRLKARRPQISVRVLESPYPELLQGVRRGDIDFLVGAIREPAPTEDIVQETLYQDYLVIVGRKEHPLFSKRALGMNDVAAYPWIVNLSQTPTHDYFDKMLAAHGMKEPANLIETNSLNLIRELLIQSEYICFVSPLQIATELRNGQLRTLHFPLTGTDRQLGLIYRKSWLPTPSQSDFLLELRSVAKEAESVL